MQEELTALKGHIYARLDGHPEALDFCLQMVQEAMDFWGSFVPMFTGFYNKLFAKVCEGGQCSKALKSACWGVATGSVRMMLDKVCKVCAQATSAYLLPEAQAMGLFLHDTLQELRIFKEFKEALIENHPLICSSMVTHLFNTYIPKRELDLAKSSTVSLEIKCNKFDKLVLAQRKLIDANSTVVVNLKREMKKYDAGDMGQVNFKSSLLSPPFDPAAPTLLITTRVSLLADLPRPHVPHHSP